jgi:hypothetical protein
MLRTALSENLMVATVIAKATYVITDHGRLELSARQRPVLLEPTKIEGVEFPPDGGYGKAGVDLLAVGSAFTPTGVAQQALVVALSVNDARFALAVIGDRHWRRRWPGWVVSDPQPFVEMPLTWARAYGGHARVAGGEVPYVDNPLGKGYVLEPATAEGVELPNIEDPAARIHSLTDQPRPVSFNPLPIGTSYAADALADVDEDGGGLTKEIYNLAIPAHRLPRYQPGAILGLHNLRPGAESRLHISLPATRLIAQVQLGARAHEFASEIDTILVLPNTRELVLTHRIVFRYDYLRGRPRVVRLRSSSFQQIATSAALEEACA